MAPKVNQGSIPSLEAGSVGAADQNETTPAEQRVPDGRHLPQTDGPNRHPKTDAFLPAEYPISREIVTAKGDVIRVETKRRDR